MFSSEYSRSEANLIHLLNSLFWPIPEPAVDQHWTTGPRVGNKCSQRNGLSKGKQETCDHPWPSPRGWTPRCVTGPDCKVQQVNRIKARKSRANFLFLSCFLTIEEQSLSWTYWEDNCLSVCPLCVESDLPHRSGFSRGRYWEMVMVCTRPVSLATRHSGEELGFWNQTAYNLRKVT